ncbi:TIGR03557 family F420-dependent LLM class oxidoreductase [Pseudonocardia acidicola]|uniref:TIGR03557 family F420-dependent LLM class oxidoreductase n=1 Tax=Pseudonocardia acidicola TaxID=2724939 RepID=A0ABX1SEG3_9PSEU|nr:TIGR03557 family F420-dependent LLM class oxidoreductase [Pseudonocardia acidicola]NMH99299.1 TIGR03557 family F420-dependent LLM class oxidoreductase [Pseudonocardia acidicola]
MVSVGYFLSCEEFGPRELVRQARLAQQAGFERLWISDHFHPWNDAQGNSPFVWSVIGALSEVTTLPISTAVTCPTMRIHPALIAQAAATAAAQCEGGFVLGVGTGEALNEHILGDRWPPAAVRQAMLEEAIGVIRELHTGREVSHHGRYYTVENARIYTRPERPVPIYVAGFGPRATRLAGRIGDGYCTADPDPEMVQLFRSSGGGDKPVQGGLKVCWAETEELGVATAHRLWASELLPGRLRSTLPRPQDFEQAGSLISREAVVAHIACGPSPERHLVAAWKYADAGFDEVYVQQIGRNQEAFFDAWAEKVLPELR